MTDDYQGINIWLLAAYLLRDVDDRLWARFKARAESEGRGRGLKFILLRLVDLYSRVGLDVLEQAAQESR